MCGLSLQQECATDHFRILLQLVGIIAMALWSCISIDFRCNYLVQLQLYWIGLLLILTVSMVILGSNNLKQCCNFQVVIATRIRKWLQLHVLVATVFQGCNKFLWCCNFQLLVATTILIGCNIMLILPQIFYVAIDQFVRCSTMWLVALVLGGSLNIPKFYLKFS